MAHSHPVYRYQMLLEEEEAFFFSFRHAGGVVKTKYALKCLLNWSKIYCIDLKNFSNLFLQISCAWNTKKKSKSLKSDAGGDGKHVWFFLLGLMIDRQYKMENILQTVILNKVILTIFWEAYKCHSTIKMHLKIVLCKIERNGTS